MTRLSSRVSVLQYAIYDVKLYLKMGKIFMKLYRDKSGDARCFLFFFRFKWSWAFLPQGPTVNSEYHKDVLQC